MIETGAEPESRAERKLRTRRAILDATLELCADSSLTALSLRQVAKQVGIVPTAFYRHFDSIESLGLALVEESFDSLRDLFRDVRRNARADKDVVDGSIDALVDHVHRRRDHFGFIARERVAGPRSVREAIRREIELCERELATDLALMTGTDTWTAKDLHVLSSLFVTVLVATAEQILSTTRPEQEEQIIATVRTQLRMLLIGVYQWRSEA
ncbi:TetR family transcriptional regulator [Nocardioides sp. WG-D5]|uniref:TetR family transcriptional regulator n=1 Tax=Nocardioides luteus TaxID=1844 RepID=UPI000202929C|nr:TetR family transcriptional regulator [Nocardioides luteus]EGD41320.1 transcriptional regulator, TetR family [Nocardioidaceae bacterium Broad-1]MBG6095090.1 AcrR family transcriptional regulator [Nocardioides luteus]